MKKAEADCAGCATPCADFGLTEEQLADVNQVRSSITTDEPLYGSATPHLLHILLCSGKSWTKWPSKVESVPGSYCERANEIISRLEEELDVDMRLGVITRPSEGGVDPEYECDVIVYPINKRYKAVQSDYLEALLRKEIQEYLQTSGLRPAAEGESDAKESNSTSKEAEQEAQQLVENADNLEGTVRILICGHKLRDRRCGLIAPILEETFEKEIRARGLTGRAFIDITSHVGGHKYAGNVIIHTSNKSLGSVWYGRVFPEHVPAIVEETVLNGRVIKPLYRGSTFDW